MLGLKYEENISCARAQKEVKFEQMSDTSLICLTNYFDVSRSSR